LLAEERWQLSALADQAAIALNNARLHELVTGEALRQRDETLEKLRTSHRKVRAILDSITDLFYHLDDDWRFTEINRRAAALSGKTQEELIGRVIWDVFPGAVGSPLETHLRKALSEGVTQHFEVADLTPGDWFVVHAYPSRTGLFVYLRDVTERKHAEITTHQLAAIVESSDDAIIGKTLDGVITSWNTGAERIFGYKPEEVIGRSVTLLIPPDRLHEEPVILEQLRCGHRIEHYETIRKRKDGKLIDVSLTVSPIKDDQGRIIGASKIAYDVTDRKRAEEEIRFQAHLLNAVEQAVIATDLDGKIVYLNSFAESLFGWSSLEAIGSSVLDIFPADSSKEDASKIFSMLKQGNSWSGEFQVKRKDGSVFPAMVTDSPIFNASGELIGIVGVSVDITERKRNEQEKARLHASEREARAQAEKANALKDEFLATMSHELRNPLNVMLGYSEVLLRNKEVMGSPVLQQAIEVLRRNVMNQAVLVHDILDLSRLHTGKLSLNQETISLATVITNSIETVSADAEARKIKLKVDLVEGVFIAGDPLRLEQVVWNLLNNAIKFTPPGGTVRVTLSSEGDDAVLVVKDTGEGIEPAFLPNVFEMFRQADARSNRRHGGMGIGLALVRQLVELHGGSVTAASEGAGRGAEFKIRIPLSHEPKEVVKRDPQAIRDALNMMRILVVDDSEDNVEMLRCLLEIEGARVTTAISGAEALRISTETKFDVIVSDISMPEMDGFEFLQKLRAIPMQRDVPALALTGLGRAEDVERAEAVGFFSHVTKPLDATNLVQILRDILPDNRHAKVNA
ncbi:MAG TPA: PAS domain S-box protein, partial [Blastocatellia bacterium]|nr:PAS domain S-box protein [Blastocatellia bacterium]